MIFNFSRFINYVLVLSFFTAHIYSQTFTKVGAPNPIAAISASPGYPGANWIDYNNDGELDLYVASELLFKNSGNSNFSTDTQLQGQIIPNLTSGTIGFGSSWADYDNDGDLDLFYASNKSYLFNNDGLGNLTKVIKGDIGKSSENRGWTCAWGDYDNDGNVDLLIIHPANFVPDGSISNTLFHNDGPPNYTFTKVTGFEFLTDLAPYTVGTWADYDLDGDIDLFIGTGPAGALGLDRLYKNLLKETGSVGFERITSSPLGSTFQNGQVWNWIDYDNDGDLDGFLTNYGGAANRLYRNDKGVYTDVAISLALSSDNSLGNTWGDFDNDGYLDVIITSDGSPGTAGKTYYFRNNGNGGFIISAASGIGQTGNGRAIAAGDYNKDGFLDVFISGFPPTLGLYNNTTSNGNGWLKLKLIGTMSNKAAIGAIVKLKATISGKSMWMMRDVSAQNTFNGHSSLDVHFGLGDASIIDSLVILWPSGHKDVFTSFSINKYETITEGGATNIDDGESFLLPSEFHLEQNYPNPFNPATKIKYSIPSESFVKINIYNSLGQLIDTVTNSTKAAGNYEVVWNAQSVSSGVYFYSINSESVSSNKSFFDMKKMIVLK